MRAVTEEDEQEFDNIIRTGDPKSYLKSYIAIREYKCDQFKKKDEGYVSHYTLQQFTNVP
jgi:hypothetical protein